MSEKKMGLNEYRNYAKAKYGEKNLNEKMLHIMDKASRGKPLKKKVWDKMQGEIKVQEEVRRIEK